MKFIYFGNSRKPNKRFTFHYLTNDGKTIKHDFGSPNAHTYIDGASELTKYNYIKRHRVREDWDEINNGSLSRYIIWGDSRDLYFNLIAYLERFDIHLI